MSVIESEISREELCFRFVDSARAGAEVKEGVIEVHLNLEVLGFLTVEAIAKKGLLAGGLRNCSRCERRKQLTAGYAESPRLRAGAFPINTSRGIVCFRQVN